MRRALALTIACTVGCSTITGDFSRVVAVLYTGPASPKVEEGDTVRLTAVALDGSGDSLPDVPVIWRVLELDTAKMTVVVDSTTGLVTGTAMGTARLQGDADGLRTDPILVTVLGVPDSIAVVEPSEVTVDSTETESPPLVAKVFDVSPTGVVTPLSAQTVRFSLVQPAPGTPEAGGVALAPSGQDPGEDPLVATTVTTSGGTALVTARRVSGVLAPDTVFIDAVALTSKGDVVAGTPARFTVLFVNP